jgi:hypothetical protein
MRIASITVGTALLFCLTLTPVEAAPKGKGAAPTKVTSSKPPTAAKTTSPKTPKTTAKVTKATTTAKASTPKPKAPKTTSTSETTLAKSETRSAKKRDTPSMTTSSTATPTTTTTVDFTSGKVGERLTKNTKLADRLASQLTALGYKGDVYQAGYGFKNLGQFVAALNNAQNHGLSFEQLKTLMTGRSVDANGVVLYANQNADGTVTMVPLEKVTNPAPTKSLGQAKRTIGTSVGEAETTTPTAGTR